MKRQFLFVAVLAGVLAGEAAITYRGRLALNTRPGETVTFAADATREMTFRVYDEKSTVRWSTNLTVRVATNGTFAAVLDAPDLTDLVTNETAAAIGLSIGSAAEIQPRQQLLPIARVNHATSAGGLVRDAQVKSLTANVLVCDTLAASNLTARTLGSAEPGGRLGRIAYNLRDEIGPGKRVEFVYGDGLSVFGGRQVLATNVTAGPSEYLCSAPTNGVATIRCVETQEDVAVLGVKDILRIVSWPHCSIVRFCTGGAIHAPGPNEWWFGNDNGPSASSIRVKFAVDFHPFRD